MTRGVANRIGTEVQADSKVDFQYLDCWQSFNQQGKSIRIADYVPNLKNINDQGGPWDNQISSCCFNGIWTLYDDIEYNSYQSDVSLVLLLFFAR